MRKQLIGSLFAFAMAGQLWGRGCMKSMNVC